MHGSEKAIGITREFSNLIRINPFGKKLEENNIGA